METYIKPMKNNLSKWRMDFNKKEKNILTKKRFLPYDR